MFVVATAIVVYFMPGDSKHKYTYELNRPWNYELLTAPFDIPVYRDSATVNHMIDSIDRVMVPIFKVDESAEARVTAVVRGSKDLSDATRRRLLDVIDRIYSGGVIDARTASIIGRGELPEVKFNIDNVNVARPTASFLSQRDAYALIDSIFRDNPERGRIQALGLSNVLNPNVIEDTRATDQYRENLIQPIVAAVGVIQQGERSSTVATG